ncbi:MAG: radical SAM/SPASM domain-containing protein [Candidatus Helarchaeota archaeon]
MSTKPVNENSEKTFDLNKKFNLPSNLIKYQDDIYNVFIQPQKAQWCIIEKGINSKIFDLLRKKNSIKEIIDYYENSGNFKIDEIKFRISIVLAEIEDKQFYDQFHFDYESLRFRELKIFLTKKCNLKCMHCYQYNDPKIHDELNYTDWLNIIEQHAQDGGESVLITGGEPTLKKELLFKLLRKIKFFGLKSILLTNGVLLTKKYIEKISPYLDEIQVSIDGPDKRTADYVRGKGNYQSVIKLLNTLKNYDLKKFISMTPLMETIDIFKDKLKQFVSNIREIDNNILFRLSKEILEGRNINRMSKEDRTNFEKRVLILEKDIFGNEYQNQLDAAFYDVGLKIESCGYGSSLFIEPDGNIYPCDLAKNKLLTNIKIDSLKKIKEILLKEMKKNSVDNLYPCSKCPLKYLCGGPCRLEITKDNYFNCSKEFKYSIINRLIKMNKWRYDFKGFEFYEQNG